MILGDVKCSSENKTEDFKPNIPANNPGIYT